MGFFVVALVLTALTTSAFAQGGGNITGTVKDKSGNPIIGAAVTIPNTARGTSTDIDGRYTIKASAKESLNFSYIGYQSQLIQINNRTTIDVVLTEDNTSLEEVVVVGYGVQKKRDIVGAVEQISSKDIADRIGSYQNVSRSLQGAIPGLTVTFSDGKPTRGASFQVRGANSIGAGGSALILVDGVETDITTVNSEDIESISVLKDASSTAVYGSRGTFGVILITTKRPEKGQMKITYNGSYNFYKRTVTPELVDNGYDWTTSYLEAYTNSYATDPTNINNVFRFSRAWYSELERRNSDPSYEKWRINPADNRYEYFGNTNWYKIFYKDYTTGHQHNLSITGGTDKASYYVSGRFFHQDGIYNAGDERYNQYNVLAKGTVQATKWLRVENTTSFMSRFSHQPTLTTGGQSFTVTPTRMMNHQGFPMTLEKNPDGTWTDAAVYMGWAGFVEGNTWREDDKFDLNNKTKFTLDFIKDVLVGEIDVSYYRNHTERHMLAVPYTYYTGPESSGERPATSWYEERYYNRERVASNAVLTWTPKLGENHWLKLMGGWNIENMDYTSTLGQNTGVIDPEHPSLSLTDGELPKAQGNGSYSASLVGTFFRVNYGYKGKYLVEVSGRYDGNSKFPSNQRWGFFPSASVGWRISEEPFMAGAKSWLDNLKIRASFGSTGNGQVDNYLFLSKIAIKKNLGFLTGDSPLIYADKPSLIPDGLTWETVSTYDLGLDWEMLNGRLSIVADIYRKNTTDMYVVGPELPAVFGNSAPKGNYADMRTDGWEASISWRDNFKLGGKDFSYNLKFAIWDNVTKVTKYMATTNTLPTNYTTNYYEGMTLGELWGYTCNGLFQSNEEAQTYADYSKFAQNKIVWQKGDPKYEDLNGDGRIDNGSNRLEDHGDLSIIGNTSPRYCYSLAAGARWNGIGLSMVWQGVGRRDWYPAKESGYFWGQYGRPYSIALPWHNDRYTDANQNTDAYWPRLIGYTAQGANAILSQPNTRYLQKARYVRLKNLTIDYTFPKQMLTKIGIQNLRIYLSGENLFTITPLKKYAKNYGPENIYAGDSDFSSTRGGDGSGDGDGYPVMRSYSIGLSITF